MNRITFILKGEYLAEYEAEGLHVPRRTDVIDLGDKLYEVQAVVVRYHKNSDNHCRSIATVYVEPK